MMLSLSGRRKRFAAAGASVQAKLSQHTQEALAPAHAAAPTRRMARA
jgi:hypothetical protein